MERGLTDPTQLAEALESVAERLGVEVRRVQIDRTTVPSSSGGGLCKLRGKHVILVDERLSPAERVALLAEALARFDLDALYLTPVVRRTIRTYGKLAAPNPRPLARARPGRGAQGRKR